MFSPATVAHRVAAKRHTLSFRLEHHMDRKPFTDVLRDIAQGRLVEELTDHMNELVHACMQTGKQGEITIKLKLRPGKAQAPTMTVLHDVNVKAPDFDRPEQYFFVDRSNTLTVHNPDQHKLPLRDAAQDRGVMREADGSLVDRETGEVLNATQSA